MQSSCQMTQVFHLPLGKKPPLPRREISQKKFPLTGTDQTFHSESHGGAHIPNLPVFPLINRDIQHRPVLIRADKDAIHEDVRKVMDRCTANGVWKVGFVAVQDPKDKTKKRRP